MNVSGYLDFVAMAEPVPIRAIRTAKVPIREVSDRLEELICSIRTNGLIQPIVLRPISDSKFEVVAGNRRFEACKRLHWTHIPSIIRETTEKEAFEIALVENIQRQSMNVLEEARAFKKYIDFEGWGGMNELAAKIGKSESYVCHRVKLLSLPTQVQEQIVSGEMKPSTAKQLVWLDDPKVQIDVAEQVIKQKLSTHSLRELVKSSRKNRPTMVAGAEKALPDFLSFVLPPTTRSKHAYAMQQTILAMRLTLARLDIIRDKCGDDPELSTFLQTLRYQIHRMIDECVRKKRLSQLQPKHRAFHKQTLEQQPYMRKILSIQSGIASVVSRDEI